MALAITVALGGSSIARIRYTLYRRSGWEFDYPTMERHLMTMVKEVTSIRPHVDGSSIHAFDDPELLKYPLRTSRVLSAYEERHHT